MIELAIIADDLTGAADTGVKFCTYFNPSYLLSYKQIDMCHCLTYPKALTVYTESRSALIEEARFQVTQATVGLEKWKPKIVYKKIDSCLRGNIGVEIDTIMKNLNYQLCFIAPALPDEGRTTVHGIHKIYDKPVADTEIGNDPVNPVKESRLPDIVSCQGHFRVGHIDLDIIKKGVSSVYNKIVGFTQTGVQIITFDTVTQYHLDLIIRLYKKLPNVLLAGSAGLAKSLVQHMPPYKRVEQPGTALNTADKGHLLMVCGSTSERLSTQIEKLIRTCPCEQLIIDPQLLINKNDNTSWKRLITIASNILIKKCLIIRTGARIKNTEVSDTNVYVKGLAKIISGVARNSKPGGLFLSGGETAVTILEDLAPFPIQLHAEIINGLVLGTLKGGPYDNTCVMTKAGAFGPDDTLIKLYNHWYNEINTTKKDYNGNQI